LLLIYSATGLATGQGCDLTMFSLLPLELLDRGVVTGLGSLLTGVTDCGILLRLGTLLRVFTGLVEVGNNGCKGTAKSFGVGDGGIQMGLVLDF